MNDLADIVTPPPPAWWPQTVGWLLVGICVLCALLWLGWRTWRHWRANRYRRAALKELGRLQAGLDANGPDRAQALLSLAELLKRTALAVWPRETVAALSGTSWRDFLLAHAGKAADAVPPLAMLIETEYLDRAALGRWPAQQTRDTAAACRRWIAEHRAPPA
ncbi:hypothetical protein D9X30_1840 [Cupriavidus sp. U2]|uniref:DUF4381 domain-containing protein n=1 Tax=Cupriavidus sp. U2 TaxID=2920269 RepID=UPI001ED5A0F6|nr:DUF4381 domain-containing protein [Cupriavidus sp. U2]KAI3592969.1 hypothetical protein D9X30_1840 [Cupriavidus sp. U2]